MAQKELPVIKTDFNRELREGMIRSILAGLIIASLLFILGSFLFVRELQMRVSMLGGGTIIICLVAYILLAKHRLQFVSILVVTLLWAVVSVGLYTAGGLQAPILTGYLIVVQLGWLLLGVRGGQIALFASIGSMIALHVLDLNGSLPTELEYDSASRLAVILFFLIVAFLLQWSAARIIDDALKRAQKSDENYRSFLENIPVITYLNDVTEEARTLYVTPQVERMIGFSQQEMLNDPTMWSKIVHPDDQDRVARENKRTTQTGESFTLDYRLITKNGETIWVRDEAALVRNAQGVPQYWLGVWTNITQRKMAEQSREETVGLLTTRTARLLTASEVSTAATSILELNELLPQVVELIRSRFDYYYVCIFLVDDTNEKAVLRAATGEMGKRMLEAGHSMLIGDFSMIGSCIANNQARIALDVGKEAVRFKNPLLPLTRSEIALPLRVRDNVIGAMGFQSEKEAAFTEWDIQALQTMADQIANAIYTARLFDERSHLLKEMESKNAELERFTYTVSHDLKSPLVTIRGYLGYLRHDAESGDLARFDKDMTRVIKSTETMQALLQDLLDLSRVGRIINPAEKVSFGDLAEETINLIMPPGLKEKIRVEVQHPLPLVRADKTRMIEVLQNLLSNAIKFMGRQEFPHIVIGSSGMDAENGYPIFFVRDNGIGIPMQFQEQIFGLFNRLHPEVKGTGIGLTLVKRIIEVHGGRVWVESEGQNRGSTFFFTLPPLEPFSPQ